MSNFVSSVYPEQGDELFMAKDRQYPQDDFYVRERFEGEPHNCPFPVPYMVVFNIGIGSGSRPVLQTSRRGDSSA